MKKISMLILTIAVCFAFGSCATPPQTEIAPPPAPPPVVIPPASDPEPPVVVTPPPPPVQEEPPPPPVTEQYRRHSSGIILDGSRTYTVVRLDTLSNIARRMYQDGAYYPLIYLVSSEIIRDVDRIYPNTVLTIPDLAVNMADPTAKAAFNRAALDCAALETSRGRPGTAELLRQRAR